MKTATLCPCGKPATAESISLAEMFPRIVRTAECADCTKRRDDAAADLAKRNRERQELAARSARLECIPPEMRRTQITHHGFNAGLWVRVEHWQPSELRLMGIVGLPANSKTRCLALLVERLIMDGHRVTWTTALAFQDKVDDLRSQDYSHVNAAREYFRQAKSAAVLVLDDIGKNTWNASMEKHLFDVIDHRKTHDLPVLWTANTHPVEILKSGQLTKDRAGALIGRLLEASRIEYV